MFGSSGDEVSALTVSELGERLCDLERERSRLEAEWAATAAVWESRAGWAGDGSLSGRSWLAHRTHCRASTAGSRLRLAGRLAHMPATAAALSSGVITVEHAQVLARARRTHLVEVFAAAEEMLVGFAARLDADELAVAVKQWLVYVDPPGGDADADELVERRGLYLSRTLDGMWVLDGLLDPESGAVVDGALAGITDELWRQEHTDEQTAAETGAVVSRPSAAQRRADALVELARRGTAAGEGSQPAQPHVTLVADLDALLGRAAGRLELGDGTSVTGGDARRIACDAGVVGAMFGADGEVLHLGRLHRFPSLAQRRALSVVHRTCAFPSCDRPFSWCHIHHIVHWLHGGPTDLDNLAPLCTRHHRHIHNDGFTMTRRPDGALAFHRPDGTRIPESVDLAAVSA